MIDKYEDINHKYYKMYEILNIKLDKSLKDLINSTNKETYNINNTFYYYNKSLKFMYLFFKYINYDKYKVKKGISEDNPSGSGTYYMTEGYFYYACMYSSNNYNWSDY